MSENETPAGQTSSGSDGSDIPSVWPPPCPHCGEQLLTSEERGLHCDGCDDLTAEDEEVIMIKFCGPNTSVCGSPLGASTQDGFVGGTIGDKP